MKKTNELIIQTEKMMSVGGLAAGMAHELNNPLGGILQGIQNIQRRLSPDLKSNFEPAKEFGIDLHGLQSYMDKRGIHAIINGVQESGKKASQIISSMLQFSRKSESTMAPINLTESIENVLELAGKDFDLKKKFDFRNIKVIKEFDSNLPLIPCTQTEIEQVILNLLNNAAWAMANEKSADPPQIILRVHVEKQMARIEIEDSGPGMDDVVRKRIFEPFFTTKPVGEGTGLGLSVSYMIITNNHKGTMEVESEPGKGTKFIIRLPLDRESVA
ncbi:MAG: HAMP domain-containing histidine kinase [Deltaproteobacteria bacterium]|nr:HAMP domain-containing histidine kinase [Deltaproteobacteria bacterium]